MTGANINDGDMLVVDRSIEPKHRHIVLEVINNEYTVKRLHHQGGVIELQAENSVYPPIRFREHEELQVGRGGRGSVCVSWCKDADNWWIAAPLIVKALDTH